MVQPALVHHKPKIQNKAHLYKLASIMLLEQALTTKFAGLCYQVICTARAKTSTEEMGNALFFSTFVFFT